MTHATVMRASRAYNKAVELNDVKKARHALVRLLGASIRQRKGEHLEGAPTYKVLRSMREFGPKQLIKARAAMVRAGFIEA